MTDNQYLIARRSDPAWRNRHRHELVVDLPVLVGPGYSSKSCREQHYAHKDSRAHNARNHNRQSAFQMGTVRGSNPPQCTTENCACTKA
jgi:hypothetical protein